MVGKGGQTKWRISRTQWNILNFRPQAETHQYADTFQTSQESQT
jgi:hypothetical protein